MPTSRRSPEEKIGRRFRAAWKGASPSILMLLFVVASGIYLATERFIAARALPPHGDDLYWSVAQLQVELERSRAELERLRGGEIDASQAQTRLAIAQSRTLDFLLPSPVGRQLSGINGFAALTEQLQRFFHDERVRHPQPADAAALVAAIDQLRPTLAEFAVQSRVAEVGAREARNREQERNQHLMSLWFALWVAICIAILGLLYRYQNARRDVASHQALLEQERAAHQATVAAELDRTTFLATISHEIRSPLQTMQVCVELIEPQIASGGKTHAALSRLKSSMAHLMTQVRDIMDISAIHNMQFRLQPEDVDLAQILHEAIDAYRVQLEGKGLQLSVALEDLPPLARLDGCRLRQIVGNLISNAIRYTDHGSVTVAARVETADGLSVLEVRVADTGIGVPADLQSRIFQPFFQGRQRRPGSSGLGLAIVKELVRLLGGEIALRSEEGRGSEFSVRLPIQLTLTAPDKTILLVDDDPNIREPFADCLALDGYAVTTAATAAEACRRLREQAFGVVLLDMQLGADSGYDVASKARDGLNRAARLIAMTAYPEEYSDPRAAWFDERLEKPFDLSRLRASLRQRG
ncbi:ATP-binding response regulator [Chromobacterium amazonense]|uniref:histidine kinase n=1 Tax=Chromobacterium amazonense TaxID=1382803 RepID=A0ABU8UZU2_9NEIS|nr:hybrid sensor histidine kinase/response regulator [Chromobacterium amazonense]MBM2885909.1 hybrid sensor histidine kinase/response regulator [Chromobacterium amazonense]MDQ4542319.1 hybrid sensor histidine kinase/response regulator [Chromobacterium amazonense]